MARVTVEDCIEKIQNRFDLVLIAAQRARGITAGDVLTIDRDRDKNPVVALREIAEESIPVDEINEELISSLQRMKRREEEQTARDEAASLAQAEMAGTLEGGPDAEEAGMQVVEGDELAAGAGAEGEAGMEGPFADEGSFADEASDDETPEDEKTDDAPAKGDDA